MEFRDFVSNKSVLITCVMKNVLANKAVFLSFLLAALLSACNSDGSGNPLDGVQTTPTHRPIVNSSSAQNSMIDLTIPPSLEPQTDSRVFDESVIFSPNFGINQNDNELRDLFSQSGVSNLCFPTALAEALTYMFAYHQPPLSALNLAGLSANRQTLDPNTLIRQLASLCRTVSNSGTDSLDAIKCVASMLSQSGYDPNLAQMISPFNQPDPSLPIVSREVTISDIRTALRSGSPVILEVGWFKFDPETKTWIRDNGHYVGIYGYDYDLSWGENQIQLKVINPESIYPSTRQASLWDTITLERVSPQPGITYPEHRPFFVSGMGFGGLTKRGFVGLILTLQ